MNTTIVQRIRAARAERGLTQKDLADHLKKTPAAISDLERGKVQVSASELYQIADLLNKPIEYFYGESIGDKEIEDLVALLRIQTPAERSAILQMTNVLINMQNALTKADKYPKTEKVPTETMREFYDLVVNFAPIVNGLAERVNQALDQFSKELKLRELEKPSTVKSKR